VLLLFPNGELPRNRWLRVPSLLTLAGLCVFPLILAVVPSAAAERFYGEPLPASVQGLQLDPVSLDLPYAVWRVVLTFTVVLTGGSCWFRWRCWSAASGGRTPSGGPS
jgi:hypothetical protein